VQRYGSGVYAALRRNAEDAASVNWEILVDMLPPEWQARWQKKKKIKCRDLLSLKSKT